MAKKINRDDALVIADLPQRITFQDRTLTITRRDLKQFNEMIGRMGKSPYCSRDPKVRYFISLLKQNAISKNKGLKPDIDKNYWCETCGSRSGKCHPQSGYCFLCDTDNWKSTNVPL